MINFLFLILSFLAHSEQSPAVNCSGITLNRGQQVVKVPDEMDWMQAFGDCRVGYTGMGLSFLFNYCTKKSEPISRGLDAFPIPGTNGELYVQPDVVENKLEFYEAKSVGRSTFGGIVKYAHKDPEFKGYYQSAGLLSEDKETGIKKIRIFMGSLRRYRDYQVSKTDKNYQVKQLGPIQRFCQNIDSQIFEPELPIINRSGSIISHRDRQTRNTVFFEIESDGNCNKLPAEIPFASNKVAFAFGSSDVDFLVFDAKTKSSRLMRMNLKTGKISSMSLPGEDVTYMTTREKDGAILYGRRIKKSNNSYDYELVLLDQNIFENNESKAANAKAIGSLWSKQCNFPIDSEMSEVVGSRMDAASCQKLARLNNNIHLEDFCNSKIEVKVDAAKPQHKAVQ